ncbi:MAG TPA: ABC transporter permease [Sporichthyaceae bacterium]|jgi:branched-subunit amino acid ABC-type transport system permease component|nr:ABC transporter permease [Sporichthyaceae bacterium]
MRDYLPFLVLGITSGSIYALAAMGLVVTYTTSGVFNFAHGTIAMVSAYAYYTLTVSWGLPSVVALLLVVLGLGPLIGVIVDRALFRRLQGAGSAAYVVVSIGLLVALQGLVIIGYGPTNRPVPQIFPSRVVRLPGVNVGYDQIAITLIAGAAGLALAMFFRRTQTGLDMRAVVDDPHLTELTGADASRTTTLAWMLGSSFASLAGVLLAPILGVDALLLTLLVVQAFGAAALGRLTSLPIAYSGAIGLGVIGQLSTKWVSGVADSHPWLAGIPNSLPFIALFGVLLVSRKGSFTELTRNSAPRRTVATLTAGARRFPVWVIGGIIAVAAVVPAVATDSRITTATTALAMLVVFSSLSLLLGLSRQISLCHAVFVALGATTLGHLQQHGVPFLPALLLSGLIVVPIAGLLSIPAVRLSGLFLALATFGFGVLFQNLLFGTGAVFGVAGQIAIQRPRVFGHTLDGTGSFYWFVLVIAVVSIVAIEILRATRLGRVLRATADSNVAVETLGVNTTAARALVFCASGFFAAIAGGLLGAQVTSVSTSSFTFFHSLIWVAVLVAAGAATLGGAVLATGLLVVVAAFFTSAEVINYQTVAFGLGAILFAQAPNGMVGGLDMLRATTAWARLSADGPSRVAANRSRARQRLAGEVGR